MLARADVGNAYKLNVPFSQPHTLPQVATGASRSMKRELAEKWVAGTQTGFTAVTVKRSIISTADVFRTSDLENVVRSFERRYLRLSRGTLSRIPAGAPGVNRVFIRGQMQSYPVLLYLWQHEAKVMSVWQFGPRTSLQPGELFALARRQDAKAR